MNIDADKLKMVAAIIAIPSAIAGAGLGLSHIGIHVTGWASYEDLQEVRSEVKEEKRQRELFQVRYLSDVIAKKQKDLGANKSLQGGFLSKGQPIPDYLITDADNISQDIDRLTQWRNKIIGEGN